VLERSGQLGPICPGATGRITEDLLACSTVTVLPSS
jgi:hypothetical protein